MDFDPSFDPYAELEVSPAASPGTIEAAWRSLLKRHHPDIVGAAAGAEKAKRLNNAHDMLADPAERRRYDAWRAERARAEEHERQRPPRPEPAPAGSAEPPRPDPSTGTSPAPRPLKLRTSPGGRPYRAGRDYAAATRVAVAGLALIGVLRVLFVVAPAGAGPDAIQTAPPIALSTPTATDGPSSTVLTSVATPSPSRASPATRPSPTARTTPEPALGPHAGSGNGGPWSVTYRAGTYAVSYEVAADTDAQCTWTLFMTDSTPSTWYATSSYPDYLPATNSDTTTVDQAGPGSMRVESDCPSWSFSLRWTGP